MPASPCDLTVAPVCDANMVMLNWKLEKTSSSGTVRNYIIQRRHRQADGRMSDWILAAIAYETSSRLSNQPAGLLEYQVKAANKADASLPTNTAAIIL